MSPKFEESLRLNIGVQITTDLNSDPHTDVATGVRLWTDAMQLEVKKSLVKGDEVELSFPLPGSKERFRVLGKVKSCDWPPSPGMPFDVTVRFLDPPSELEAILSRTLAERTASLRGLGSAEIVIRSKDPMFLGVPPVKVLYQELTIEESRNLAKDSNQLPWADMLNAPHFTNTASLLGRLFPDNGFKLKGFRPITKDRDLFMDFELPGIPLSFNLIGRVMWTEGPDELKMFLSGLQFRSLSNEDGLIIERFLSNKAAKEAEAEFPDLPPPPVPE